MKADQEEKKRDITNTILYFKDLKDKELERQVKENAEIARETEKENKQFDEMFSDRFNHTEKQLDFIFDASVSPPEHQDLATGPEHQNMAPVSEKQRKVRSPKGCIIS